MKSNSHRFAKNGIRHLKTKSNYRAVLEFLLVFDYLRRFNHSLRNWKNKAVSQTTKIPDRYLTMYFFIEAKHATELRHLIMSLCGESVIFMRVKPIEHATFFFVEVQAKVSAAQEIRALINTRFPCELA